MNTISEDQCARPVKVGVDMHVVSGLFQGSRTHVIELFSRAVTMAPDIEFHLLCSNPDDVIRANEAFARSNVHLHRLRFRDSVRRVLVDLPAYVAKCNLDVLHVQYIGPLVGRRKTMVTIHDVLFETHPQYFPALFRARSRMLMRHTAQGAMHTFTVSHYSKDALIARYALDANDITVIHNGVDRCRFNPTVNSMAMIRRRGLAPGSYILTVGRLEPRKNHIHLLRAWSQLGEDAPPLVIAGQRDFGYREIFEFLRSCSLADRVHVLEDVSDAELPELMRNALLFAYVSHAEGFGMPPLEAMACGVPVVAMDTTALPEVVGGAGILVPPGDVGGLTEAMRVLLKDHSCAAALARAGLERVVQFSWEASAEKVVRQYRRALCGVKGVA